MKRKINYIKISPKSLNVFYILNKRNKDIRSKTKITNCLINQFSFFKLNVLRSYLQLNYYFNNNKPLNSTLVGLYKEVNLNVKYAKIEPEYKYVLNFNFNHSLSLRELDLYIYMSQIINLYNLLIILNKNYIHVVTKKKTNK